MFNISVDESKNEKRAEREYSSDFWRKIIAKTKIVHIFTIINCMNNPRSQLYYKRWKGKEIEVVLMWRCFKLQKEKYRTTVKLLEG